MKAIGYVRVSTEDQARDGYGLPAQEHAIRAYCDAQGWELTAVYADAGKSGKALQGREALTRLLADAEASHFQRVVFVKLDRLARNLRDLLDLCSRLEGAGVGIVSISESIDTGTPSGRMIRSVLGALGEFERETICERTRDGIAEVLRQGKAVGRLPVGFQRKDGALILDLDTAPKVEELFRRYASGQYSLRELTPWAVQHLGIRTFTSLGNILRNAIYLGHISYRGKVVAENAHQPIVEKALFDKVQEQLSRRTSLRPARPFGNERYPLTGIAVCGRCGAPMVGTGGKKRQRYIRCQTTHRMGKAACSQPMVRAEILEEQVADYLSGMILPQDAMDGILARAQKAWDDQYDTEEAARLRRELERWRRLFVLGEIDEGRLKRETASLNKRLSEVDRPREVLDVEIALGFLRALGSAWKLADTGLKRKWVQAFYARVVVDGPQVVAVQPKSLYAPLFILDRQERFGGVVEMLKPSSPRSQPSLTAPTGRVAPDLASPSPGG